MAVARFEMIRREPYATNADFGGSGPYERIDAIAHYAVDPTLPGNDRITDLSLAERKHGKVEFTGDVTLLVPRGKANRALLVNFPNRGNRTATRLFNRAPFELVPTDEIDPGDGFLMRHGWTVAFCGWQWDAPKPGPRMGITPPQVPPRVRNPDGNMHLRIQPNEVTAAYPLTDHHVGSIGQHRPIAARNVSDAEARLLVRPSMYGEAEEISRNRWQFARDELGAPVADAEWVRLEGGFQPGLVYDLIYVPRDCPVAGAGLLAMRDLAAFLRRHPASPLAGNVDHVIGEGISQCGRLMRTFLGLGLNTAEDGGPAYDGLLIHVAGGRRGEFNMRYGQPSVQPTPAFGHLFPFADDPTHDPASGRTAGLLDLQRAAGNVPKIFQTDTSAEYWRGDASLAHIAPDASRDLELPREVRRYLYGSTQHTPGALPFADLSPFGSHGSNWFNVVDYRPLHRAGLMSLLAWIRDGNEPPASVYPRLSDGTAVTRAQVVERLAKIPGLVPPVVDLLPGVRPLEVGRLADRGIGTFPARPVGPPYLAFVAALDADGNETGAVRMPDVEVPIATHTGFNVRHPRSGGAGQLLEYVGLTVPFPRGAAERVGTGDPRPAIAERYGGRSDYLARVRAAARRLTAERLLLEEDIELCVDLAAERYDACMK
jgi:hypothetical protein